MWLEAKKRVKPIWVPEIMIDDHKGYTNFYIFLVFSEPFKRLCSKQSSLKFCIVMPFFWHKQPPDYQTIKSSVTAILKAMTNTVFGTKFSYSQNFFIHGGRFFLWERVLWCWLAGPSHWLSNILALLNIPINLNLKSLLYLPNLQNL